MSEFPKIEAGRLAIAANKVLSSSGAKAFGEALDELETAVREYDRKIIELTRAAKPAPPTSCPDDGGTTFQLSEGVHWGFNGDRYPGTIVQISKSGREIYVSDDEYKIVDNKGGFVEGDRECVFKSVMRPLDKCHVFKLTKKKGVLRFRDKSGWALCKGRAYAQNPSF